MESTSFSAFAIYRRLFEIARPYRLHLAGMLLISLAATPLVLLTPLPLKIVVDRLMQGRTTFMMRIGGRRWRFAK